MKHACEYCNKKHSGNCIPKLERLRFIAQSRGFTSLVKDAERQIKEIKTGRRK